MLFDSYKLSFDSLSLSDQTTHYLTHFNQTHVAKHVKAVAAKAKELAIHFGKDPIKAEQAGLLHDISAVVPNNKRIALAHELGIEVMPEEEKLPMIIHQKLSRVFAKELFGIDDDEVLSAIECHTTLKANASLLDKVVFIADKIAWDQKGTPPYLVKLLPALDKSLDAGVFVYIDYLWQMREKLKVVHPWLVDAYHDLETI